MKNSKYIPVKENNEEILTEKKHCAFPLSENLNKNDKDYENQDLQDKYLNKKQKINKDDSNEEKVEMV